MRNSIFNCLFLVILVFGIDSSEAVVLKFTDSGKQYRNKTIHENTVGAVGIVGDYFEVGDGSHTFVIYAPKNHLIRFDVNVKGETVKIENLEKAQLHVDGPIVEWTTTWKNELRMRRKEFENSYVLQIVLPAIKFISKKTSDTSSMNLPSSLGCNRLSYSINATTQPENAKIWIDGKETNFRTPVKLKATYCEWAEHVIILARKKNRINCQRKFEVTHNAEIIFHCDMKKP